MATKNDRWNLLLITCILGGMNAFSVYGLDILIQDDLGVYNSLVTNTLNVFDLWRLPMTSRFLRAPLLLLLSVNMEIPRLMVLLFWMIPVALLTYYLCSRYFRFPSALSVGAAILPAIFPRQLSLPAFIDGSYMIEGLLFLLISLITALKFVERPKSKSYLLSIALASYVLASFITELAILVLIPMILMIFGFSKARSKSWVVSALLVGLCFGRIILFQYFPRSGVSEAGIGQDQVLIRGKFLATFLIPIPSHTTGQQVLFGGIGFLILILSSLTFVLVKKIQLGQWRSTLASPWWISLFFSLSWLTVSIIPFIFFSQYITERHFYFAGFGWIIFLLSLLGIVIDRMNFITSRGRGIILWGLISILVTYFGISRLVEQKVQFELFNHQAASLKKELSRFSLPDQSQLMITGDMAYSGKGGNFFWSSGYLKHITGRVDLTGQVSAENSFYNAFDTIRGRSYSIVKSGLNLNHPVFLFRQKDWKLIQYHYALKWDQPDNIDSGFTILKFDSVSGISTCVYSGKGLRKFVQAVDSLSFAGVERNEIMFAKAFAP